MLDPEKLLSLQTNKLSRLLSRVALEAISARYVLHAYLLNHANFSQADLELLKQTSWKKAIEQLKEKNHYLNSFNEHLEEMADL